MNKTALLLPALLTLAACTHPAAVAPPDKMVQVRFQNTPLQLVMDNYAEWLNCRTFLDSRVGFTHITLHMEAPQPMSETLSLIGTAITNAGVEIIQLQPGILVFQPGPNFAAIRQRAAAAASEASAASRSITNQSPASGSYADRRRQRLTAEGITNAQPQPKYTGEALKKHLEQYNMEVIRQGLPPLSIPLTKDQEEQLKREGSLPSPTNAPPASTPQK